MGIPLRAGAEGQVRSSSTCLRGTGAGGRQRPRDGAAKLWNEAARFRAGCWCWPLERPCGGRDGCASSAFRP